MAKPGTFQKGHDPRRTGGKKGRSGGHGSVYMRELERERLAVLRDAKAARKRQAAFGLNGAVGDGPAVSANKSIIDAGARILAESLPKRVEHTGEGGGPIVSKTGLVIEVIKEGA